MILGSIISGKIYDRQNDSIKGSYNLWLVNSSQKQSQGIEAAASKRAEKYLHNIHAV